MASIGAIDYIRNVSGDVLGEWQSGNVFTGWNRSYVYMGGKLIAEYRDGTTYFRHDDHLGTARVLTMMNQAIHDSIDYQPYGEQSSGDTGTTHKFTGKERDGETLLDDFGARYYSPTMGRFMTPDWAARPVSVPYAVFGDPQSLNLYGYVRNDPVSRADADGHADCSSTPDKLSLGPPTCTSPHKDGAATAQGGFWQKLGNVLNDRGWATNAQVAATEAKNRADWAKAYPGMPYPDMKVGAVTPFGGVGAAAARAGELAGAMGKTANFVTIAVTETEEGVNVVSSSENALRPAVKAMLGEGEVAAQGAGHAEVTGVNAAQQMGLTPTGVAASRGICPSCAQFLEDLGVAALSFLK
jgi:RHS repeat-associated protein